MKNERLDYNLELISLLRAHFLANPNERFIQALFNLNIMRRNEDSEIVDLYYEESKTTLTTAKESKRTKK